MGETGIKTDRQPGKCSGRDPSAGTPPPAAPLDQETKPGSGFVSPTLRSTIIANKKAVILVLVALYLVGFAVRFEEYFAWRDISHLTFVDQKPLNRGLDGYIYLDHARDLRDGNYGPQDVKRAVPDRPDRPWPPPLFSVFMALTSKLTGVSLMWISATMGCFLAPLIILPLFFLGRQLYGDVMGLVAAALAVTSPLFVERSNFGWGDTDILVIPLLFSLAALFLAYSRRREIHLLGAASLCHVILIWWWDQAPQVVLAFYAYWLLASAFMLRTRQEHIYHWSIAFIALFLSGLIEGGASFFIDAPAVLWGFFQHIEKADLGFFPNVGVAIQEQRTLPLLQSVYHSANSLPPFFLGATGVGALLYQRRKAAIFLAPLIIVGILGFFAALRFLIFMGPVIALGIGYFANWWWQKQKDGPRSPLEVALFIVTITLVIMGGNMYKNLKSTFGPASLTAPMAKGIIELGHNTPDNAVIWSWWDFGNPILFLANRATVADGIYHEGERLVYTAFPLVTPNPRLAANFMRFYVVRGMAGMANVYAAFDGSHQLGLDFVGRVMAAGPDSAIDLVAGTNLRSQPGLTNISEWLRFFFPPAAPPIYLYMPRPIMFTMSSWWYWFGSWNVDARDGRHVLAKYFDHLSYDGKSKFSSPNDAMQFDLDTGIIQLPNGYSLSIQRLLEMKGNTVKTRNYQNDSSLVMLLSEDSASCRVMEYRLYNSTFAQLNFFARNSHYFQPGPIADTPDYSTWQVTPDPSPFAEQTVQFGNQR